MKMRSMDGGVFRLITWVRIATGLALLFCAAWADAGQAWSLRGPNRLGIELYGSYIDARGELILVGTRGAVLRLKSPSEWSMDQWNPDQNYSAAAEGNGVSVRVGDDHFQSGRRQSSGWSSRDGVHWTPFATNISYSLPRLAFGNGHFVVGVETAKAGEQGVFLVSEDGIHWTASDGKGSVVAVGEGVILHHREEDSYFEVPRLVFRKEGDDLFLSFYQQSLCGYHLQFSSDLRHWRTLTSIEGVIDPTLGPDSAMQEWRIPLRGAAQFYRLHLAEN